MGLRRILLSILLLLTISSFSLADVTASVSYGWNSSFRPNRWNPVYVTVASDRPRQVLIQFYIPHDRTFSVAPHILAAASPRPTTYCLIVPLNTMVRDSMVTVLDPATHRRLAYVPFIPESDPNRYAVDFENTASGDMLFIGVTGARNVPTLKSVKAAAHDSVVGFLSVNDLPTTPIGYDSLDILVLNNPNFADFSLDQQNAIVEWVRSGGRLILVPGESTVPAGSVLESILPADLGDVKVLDLPDSFLKSFKLPGRFAHLHSRALSAHPDAKPYLFYSADPWAYHHRVGFGQVMLFSFDASQLAFEAEPAHRFWQPVIESLVQVIQSTQPQNYYSNGVSDNRRNLAINPLMEFLGDVPGVGRFDFSYVAWALIGLMLLVGPVDWFVLKRLGRQPWTWLTSTAWVALLTIVALLLGQSLRAGDLYYRTIDIVDEADNAAIAKTTLAGMYSPRTENYAIAADAESWWQPLAANNDFYFGQRGAARSDIDFTQTYRGNLPDPMRVNIWTLRFLEAASIAPAPARINAALKITPDQHCLGTITNTGDTPLSNIIVRTGTGTIALTEILPPGQTRVINSPIDHNGVARFNINPQEGYPYRNRNSLKPSIEEVTILAGNLAADRSTDIEHFVNTGHYACVYALAEPTAAPSSLSPTPKVEKHYLVVRSLTSLNQP